MTFILSLQFLLLLLFLNTIGTAKLISIWFSDNYNNSPISTLTPILITQIIIEIMLLLTILL